MQLALPVPTEEGEGSYKAKVQTLHKTCLWKTYHLKEESQRLGFQKVDRDAILITSFLIPPHYDSCTQLWLLLQRDVCRTSMSPVQWPLAKQPLDLTLEVCTRSAANLPPRPHITKGD